MGKKRMKKALSHVDWAIALSIFLMYLAWFFIFVKPHLAPSENIDTLMDILEEGVDENIYTTTNRIEIYIPNEVRSQYEPVIIDFTRNYTEIAHSADHYEIDEGRMLFFANTSASKRYTIYNPMDASSQTDMPTLVSTENKARVGSFTAEFDEGLLSELWYNGEKRLWDFYLEIDGTEMNNFYDYENFGMFAKYKRQDSMNQTSYVFAENSRVYNYLASTDQAEHTVTVSFTVYNYTNYFTDTERELDYRIREECRALDSDFLDLYDGDTGILIVTDQDTEFMLCTNETAATVEFDANRWYHIFAHDGRYTEVKEYPLTPRQGTEEELILVSREKILSLKNRNYQYLKTRFGFPLRRDFNITIESDAVTANLGTRQPETQDIYAKRMKGYIIDQAYDEKAVNITMTVW